MNYVLFLLALAVIFLGIRMIAIGYKTYKPRKQIRAKRRAAVFPECVPETGDQLQWYDCDQCRRSWLVVFDKNGQARTPDILNAVETHQCDT